MQGSDLHSIIPKAAAAQYRLINKRRREREKNRIQNGSEQPRPIKTALALLLILASPNHRIQSYQDHSTVILRGHESRARSCSDRGGA